jgi:alginate O-acetyltransferase complex protein AlgI
MDKPAGTAMLFTKLNFIIFFTVIMVFLHLVKNNRARKIFLLIASYYFYANWDWRFCGLLLFSTAVDYTVGMLLSKTEKLSKRKILLAISLCTNLGLLGFFRYFNFFVSSMQTLLEPAGIHLQTLEIILPVGISFYTFQTCSYTIDVYRRKLKPCKDVLDFALYVSFFPQLVAGPIVRASDFLPQLESKREMTWQKTFEGLRLFIFGLTKKVLIADHLAMVSDFTFENIAGLDGWTTWAGVICYTGQIYSDFSGYTDMAIGAAKMMGYEFTKLPPAKAGGFYCG